MDVVPRRKLGLVAAQVVAASACIAVPWVLAVTIWNADHPPEDGVVPGPLVSVTQVALWCLLAAGTLSAGLLLVRHRRAIVAWASPDSRGQRWSSVLWAVASVEFVTAVLLVCLVLGLWRANAVV